MKLLLHYLKRNKKWVFLTFLLALINQLFSMLDPFFYGKLLDNVIAFPKNGEARVYITSSFFLISCAVGVAMISRVAKALQDYFLSMVIQKFGVDVYTDGLQHAMQLPYEEFEDQSSGSTLNVLQRVRTDTEKFMQSFLNVFFTGIVGIIFVLFYSFQVYGMLVPIYFFACAILFWVIKILSEKIKIVQAKIVKQTNVLAGATTESLRNIELIKSLGLTMQEVNRLNLATSKILELELQKVRSIRSISFLQGTLVNLLRQSILFVLLYLIFKDQLSIGQLATLQMYSFFIFNPLQEMGNVLINYREADASLHNFKSLLNKPIEVIPQNAMEILDIEEISFRSVSFKHKTAANFAVSDITFKVKNGETVAFVGPSGSGKTTLVKLLVGLYRPDRGEIMINNHDLNVIDFNQLRSKIGIVSQDTQLFAGTIKENLLFVNKESTDEQMIQVLEMASCQNLLNRSDLGLDSIIGEGGMKISGGEKQRLSIARALLRSPDLLIFDEATSALDSITEADINKTIQYISRKKEHIMFIIAHRLSTIMHADTIFVLEKGVIVERGKHDELLKAKGLYYAMWRQQIGER